MQIPFAPKLVILGFLGIIWISAHPCQAQGQKAGTPLPNHPQVQQPANLSKVERLIRQLGSEKFAEREAATKALEAIGEPALEALRRATRDGDLELRRRAEQLVKSIEGRMYRELHRFDGHKAIVMKVAFTPDGRGILSGSKDGTARLWDTETGKEVWRFPVKPQGVHAVAFSPDGKQAAAGTDLNVLVWDVGTAKERYRNLLRFQRNAHTRAVLDVAFSPDGRQILSGSQDGTVVLCDTASGRQLRLFRVHDRAVYAVAFSPDGKQVLSGGEDGTVRLRDAKTGEELRRLSSHKGIVHDLAVSPDGSQVLSGGADGTWALWDLKSGEEIRRIREDGKNFAVAFSPDGRRILSAGSDKTMRLWDIKTGKEMCSITGHTGYVTSVAFSPDGRRAVSCGEDRTVRLWALPK
jgi:WD40 repeat protein